jgi:hypothetical protein
MIANFNHNHQKIFGVSWKAVVLAFPVVWGKKSGAVIQQSAGAGLTLVPKYSEASVRLPLLPSDELETWRPASERMNVKTELQLTQH